MCVGETEGQCGKGVASVMRLERQAGTRSCKALHAPVRMFSFDEKLCKYYKQGLMWYNLHF